MGAGGVSHEKDVPQVQSELLPVFQGEPYRVVHVLEAGGEPVAGRQAVIEVHHGEAPAGQIHAVMGIQDLVAVDPSPAVDIDDHGDLPFRIPGTVDIEEMPPGIGSVGDVIETEDLLRSGQSLIPFPVVAGRGEAKQICSQRHGGSSFLFPDSILPDGGKNW